MGSDQLPADGANETTLDPAHFREVLGQYPTGVVVVTTVDPGGTAHGMTVGSFTSVSLDPPLVAFLPEKTSSSWNSLKAAGTRFCVNILSASQEQECRLIATRKTDKFIDIPWHPSPSGNPIIDGAVGYVDCEVQVIHDAGDHVIVVGRVLDLAVLNGHVPLLFFRGGYGSFRPLSLASGDVDLLDQLRRVDRARGCMEELAADLDCEVTANFLVHDELVLAAAAGRTPGKAARVGRRMPFMAPLGGIFAAWGDSAVRHRWVYNLDSHTSAERFAQLNVALDRVREQGYTAVGGREPITDLGRVVSSIDDTDYRAFSDQFRQAALTVAQTQHLPDLSYDTVTSAGESSVELHTVAAPVFGENGGVEFTLTAALPPHQVSREAMKVTIRRVVAASQSASAAIVRSPL
jgi:flavin reductase (DIM6/NTAB) family NADH-FMN oxidoreductase RutF/DNA-binding IclR family transcriptional regulator